MTNFDHSKRLAAEATRTIAEAENAYYDGDWNYTIRRAQESVELHLKSLLVALNIEFPKVHDIGAVCVKELEKKRIPIAEETGLQIIQISKELSEKRGPAFYWEEDYTKEEAKEALDGAKFINTFFDQTIKKLLEGEQ